MITIEEARKIGINACIDKIGRDIVLANRDNCATGYGEEYDGKIFCFVAVSTRPPRKEKLPRILILDSTSRFDYEAGCNVSLKDGSIEFIKLH